MRPLLYTLCVSANLACAGSAHRAPPPTNTRRLPSPSTEPVKESVSSHRVTVLRSGLLYLQQQYLAQEGYGHRASRFASLASALQQASEESQLMEFELLALLGPPDYGESDGRGALFIYLFDRNGSKDWYVSLELNPSGALRLVGWNATSQIDLGLYKPYKGRAPNVRNAGGF